MPCTEINNAFDWAKQSTNTKDFPVRAYFTKHDGILTDPIAPPPGDGRDSCWYAVGRVRFNGAGPVQHLSGDLQLFLNKGSAGEMKTGPGLSLAVEIFPDGTVTYQQKLNGDPVGGFPPHTVTTTCIGGVLLTGTEGNKVITVGVRRDAPEPIL